MCPLLHADLRRVADCNTSAHIYVRHVEAYRRALGTRGPSLTRRRNFGMSYTVARRRVVVRVPFATTAVVSNKSRDTTRPSSDATACFYPRETELLARLGAFIYRHTIRPRRGSARLLVLHRLLTFSGSARDVNKSIVDR